MREQLLAGKVAIVTGAGGGIGRATAILFAEVGAKVVVSDVAGAAANATVESILAKGGDAIAIAADVSDEAAVQAMVRQTVERFGRLDCAVNNAGVDLETKPVNDWDTSVWNRTIDINLRGLMYCMHHEINQMRAQKGGAIVNISSIAGLVAVAGKPSYVAAKHGVVGITRVAGVQYASEGIRVNAVCPGGVKTGIMEQVIKDDPSVLQRIGQAHPIGRVAESEEIAEAALFLCSDRAGFITAATLAVDGGLSAQ